MDRLPGSVLFVCSANSIRSPMAEGIAKHLFGDRVFVDSAGIEPGEPDGFAVEAMDELGIDLSHHKPKALDELNDTSFDLVVSLSAEARPAVAEMTRTLHCTVEHWPLPDPSTVDGNRDIRMNAYRSVRDALMARIKRRFDLAGAPVV